jgi:hypothetical protein
MMSLEENISLIFHIVDEDHKVFNRDIQKMSF